MKSTNDNKSKQKGIHTGHRQRVRERFLNAGIESFQLHEILEFLLFFGIPFKDTNALAHNLIEKYGSFSAVFDAPVESLKNFPGMTENAAVLIKALPDIYRSYSNDKMKQTVYIGSLIPCVKLLRTLYAGLTKEEMYILFLDKSHKLISYKKLAKGSVDEVRFSIREIQEAVFFSNATNVIIAHNHPSGNVEPSKEDIDITKIISQSLSYINVVVLDHVIVSDNKHFSFNRKGLLEEIKNNCSTQIKSKFTEDSEKWLAEE